MLITPMSILEILLNRCYYIYVAACVFKPAAALTYAIVLEFSTRWLKHITKNLSTKVERFFVSL